MPRNFIRTGLGCALAALVLCGCYTRKLPAPGTQDARVDAWSPSPPPDARPRRDAYVSPSGHLLDCADWQDPPALQKTCGEASEEGSNVGCVYWPTPTANSGLDAVFDDNFGVVVHNPGIESAHIVIQRGLETSTEAIIPAGELRSFELPLDTGLKLSYGQEQSLQVEAAAYRLESTLPVAVYQFNPLDYRVNQSEDPLDYSYSNDASLVLPEHGLGTEYIVSTRPTFGIRISSSLAPFQSSPGFFAVVATRPDTVVTIHFTALTQWGPTLPSYGPGDTDTFTLQPGEVLQVTSAPMAQCNGTEITGDCSLPQSCEYCDGGRDYDLTGTHISSSAPVAVFSGHNCTFVPFDVWACDHLEEQLLPVTAWGTEYVVTRTVPQTPQNPEPNIIRILSASDDNEIRFDPPQADGASTVLFAGEWTELESGGDFVVTGDGPLLVIQHTVGADYDQPPVNWQDGVDQDKRGDPAMGQVVPVGQFRRNYYVLAPDSIPDNYLNVVRPRGPGEGETWLDGCRVLPHAFVPVGRDGSYEVARIPIGIGPHRLVGDVPVGIMGYGFAPYTSYLYPAGLNLHTLCDVQ